MKREIEFRGKRQDNGEWVYGYLCPDRDGDMNIITKQPWEPIFRFKVNPDTIGQYTGLKDRNGVKIFEGDVVKEEGIKVDVSGGKQNGVIVFEASWIEVKWSNVSSDSIGMFFNYGDRKPQLVVTGNIHESGGGEG